MSVDSRFDLASATDADHAAIHRLLRAVFQQPSAAAFQSLNDAPQYDPTDRLVVKRSDEVVAHVHLVPRILKFGSAEIRSTDLRHLATLPEYRDSGLANRLLNNALSDMARNGSVVATTHTPSPDLYRTKGWVTCGYHCESHVSPRDLLSHLESSRKPAGRFDRKTSRRIYTRHLRQHELDQISEIYRAETDGGFGPLVRRQSHWRWLMSRRAMFDRAYVAVEQDLARASDHPDEETAERIVGYAVVRGERIVEFATLRGDVAAIRQLLARTCRDAIEEGRHSIGLVASIDHSAHELIVAAGGQFRREAAFEGRELMAQILDMDKFLQLLKPTLWDRARQADLPSGSQFDVDTGEQVFRFTVNKRSVGIANAKGEACQHRLAMDNSRFSQLLLGFLRVEDELREGRIAASTESAGVWAAKLWPSIPFWRPLLDDVSER